MESADVSETEIHESRSTYPKKFKKLESGFLVLPPIWGSGSVEVETDQSLIEFLTGHMEAQHAYRKRISSPPPAPSGLLDSSLTLGSLCLSDKTLDQAPSTSPKKIRGSCHEVETLIYPPDMSINAAMLQCCTHTVMLQCCTHTVPILKSFGSYNRDVQCLRLIVVRDFGYFCVFCTLREHVEDSLKSSGGVICPSKFVDNLSSISSSFKKCQQEDAHEFLKVLLERLEESCCFHQVLSSFSQEHSFVRKIFGGRLKSELQCSDCGHCSDKLDPFNDLSLVIEDVETLPDALISFTSGEIVEDHTCAKCEQKTLARKRFTLDQAPPVAIFHFMRFKMDDTNSEKISKYVKYQWNWTW